MPVVSSGSGGCDLVPISPESKGAEVYPLHHGLKSPIARLSISWSRGNSLRVSVFASPSSFEDDAGGEVVEMKLGGGDCEISDAHWRRMAYGSVSPFALLQSRKNADSSLSKMTMKSSPYGADWWDYILEYSKDINALLGSQKSASVPVIDDPKSVIVLKLLKWKDRPLLNVSQTNLVLTKLQDLSMARLRPYFIDSELPPQALNSVRLALATNLGRAILEE